MCAGEDVTSWYAVRVRSPKEQQVGANLVHKGFDCFLPMHRSRRIWSDRVKVTEIPLFPGYVFSRFDAQFRLPILTTPNVLQVVGYGGVPAPIATQELDAIRVAVSTGFPLEPLDAMHEGDPVRVIAGPLTGVEGSLMRFRGQSRLLLSVSLIRSSITVEIDRAYVEPLLKRAPKPELCTGVIDQASPKSAAELVKV